jgi:hypothetical protein
MACQDAPSGDRAQKPEALRSEIWIPLDRPLQASARDSRIRPQRVVTLSLPPPTSGRVLRAFQWLTATEKRICGSLALFTVITRLPILTYPKACDDEQVYVVVAREMVHAGRPYVDAVERKPPLLFYLYDAILRLCGEYNYFALHVVSVLWTMATMMLLYLIARRLFDRRTGFVAALTYAIFIAWANYTNLAFNGELLMNLPVVAAFAIAFRHSRSKLRADLLAAGALIAVAFLLKQPAVAAALPLGLYLLQRDYPRTTRPALGEFDRAWWTLVPGICDDDGGSRPALVPRRDPARSLVLDGIESRQSTRPDDLVLLAQAAPAGNSVRRGDTAPATRGDPVDPGALGGE